MAIRFHTIEIAQPRFGRNLLRRALSSLIKNHGKDLGNVDVVFCSDEELLKMNLQFLNHDFYTDVITFDYSEGKIISGDIFISIDRIRENARKLKISTEMEIRRIVGHGILHLIGFDDKLPEEKKKMTVEEELFLKYPEFS